MLIWGQCMVQCQGIVGGKMVQCESHLWRWVSAIRICCNYHRSRILSLGGFLLESRSLIL